MKLSSVQTPLPPFLLLLFLLPHPFLVSLSLSTPISKVCNRVLALDEVVQFTEQDEWAYHEMVAHVPLFSHPNPRSVSAWCMCNHVGAVTVILLHSCFLSLFFSPSFLLLPLSPVSFLVLLSVCLLSSPSPHSLFGSLTPLTFLSLFISSSLPAYLPPLHLPRCWW